jgi:cytochrome c oxidase assembly protein subunit 11
MTALTHQPDNSRLIRRLLAVVVGMFFFGFALVPAYSVFCKLTGFNGNKANAGPASAAAVLGAVDTSRTVTVEFVASVNENMPWEFRPDVTRMQVHPGEYYMANFYARNQTRDVMIGQAIPSVTPSVAALHFHKTECFCFTQQRFGAGEGREMPLRFVVDKDLPGDVHTLTLAYTFFDVTQQALAK